MIGKALAWSAMARLLVLATAAVPCGAMAGQRVAVEGSSVTVKMPAGWVIAPISTDAPFLGLMLCDPPWSDENGCAVKGEMSLEQLTPARAPISLEALLLDSQTEYAQAADADRVLQPRTLKVAERDAVEAASIVTVHFNHGGGQGSTGRRVYHALTLQDRQTYYRCALSVTPSMHTTELRQALTEFCSSIQFPGTDRLGGEQ